MNSLKPLNPRITCADGTGLSVQAGLYLYSTPLADEGPYSEVEVGFIRDAEGEPLAPPPAWLQYAEDAELPSSVYGYVPVSLVEELIAQHGGIKTGRLP